MLFGRKNKLGDSYETPIFGTTESGSSIPKEELGKDSIAPNIAYRLIKDELMNEGNARLNLCNSVKHIWKMKQQNLWQKH
ncbi:glutamate decarboxylase domain protein [[Clostridium] sordellii ATCC 9714]|nr:glutamate decarboxylase domain protein [[Clostridium] sordellii ATCC 9714] [Paeniclostridium sordellii ATCC 9714]